MTAHAAAPEGGQTRHDDDNDRRGLSETLGVPDEVSGVLRAGARLRRMEAFDVGLLEGEAWPGNQDRGAVHRSPPGTSPRGVVMLDALA